LRSPALADRVRALGDYVRFENALPAVLREFAIMLVARFWRANYEWTVHRQLAVQAGLDPIVADAVAAGQPPTFTSPEQSCVYEFMTQLLYDKDVSDDTYSAALDRFGERGVLDLLATAGYFSFVSLVLNAKRHPVPENGTLLPPLPTAEA
jgi:4-carboxymuconolactone decarboxylase